MSKVHILKGAYKVSVGEINSGSYSIVFHIPIINSKAATADAVSVLPGITVAEKAKLEAGTLVEIAKSINYNSNSSKAELKARLLAEWSEISASENTKYDFENKFYLTKYD